MRSQIAEENIEEPEHPITFTPVLLGTSWHCVDLHIFVAILAIASIFLTDRRPNIAVATLAGH